MANVQQMPSATVVRVVRKQARATCPNIVRTIKTIVHPTSLCRAVKRAVLPKACVMLPRLVMDQLVRVLPIQLPTQVQCVVRKRVIAMWQRRVMA